MYYRSNSVLVMQCFIVQTLYQKIFDCNLVSDVHCKLVLVQNYTCIETNPLKIPGSIEFYMNSDT